MLNIKTRLVAAAALAGLAFGAGATVLAQDHAAPTAEQIAAHEAMVTAVMKAVLVETDFEAVKTHMVAAIEAHAGEIGDAEATVAHVSHFLDEMAAQVAADPDQAAAFTARMMLDAHRPQ